jgi:hypothetical protein
VAAELVSQTGGEAGLKLTGLRQRGDQRAAAALLAAVERRISSPLTHSRV